MTIVHGKQRRPNNLVWFELPVSDLKRATSFYESIFATKLLTDERFPGIAMFPREHKDAVTGALSETGNLRPSPDGAVVYLNCDGQLDAVLKRAAIHGGKVLKEVAQLPGDMGFTAQLEDLDGNRVGLHATF